MSGCRPEGPHDKSLGMNCPICRRDFLNSTLLASGGLLLSPLIPRQLLPRTTGQGSAEISLTEYRL